MNTVPKSAALLALLAIPTAADAAFITGSVNFSSGPGGGIVLQNSAGNTTTNLADATGLKSWLLAEVDTGSGAFSTVPDGTPVVFNAPWIFNPSTSMTPLWTISGPENFSFNLTSSVIVFQNSSFLSIKGTGTLTGSNYQSTPGTWSFTTQGRAVDSKFSWSAVTAGTSVPDAGTTMALLAGSLLGILGLRSKLGRR